MPATVLKPGELVAPESSLYLPGILPRNFMPGPDVKVAAVTSDMYNICERLADVNPRLQIHEITDTKNQYHYFAICERIPIEGGYRDELVMTTEELDSRTVDYCQYLMKVPLAERMEKIRKIEEKAEKDNREFELDKMYEDFGAMMLRQLYHDGFVQGAKPNANIPYKRKRM